MDVWTQLRSQIKRVEGIKRWNIRKNGPFHIFMVPNRLHRIILN